MALIPLAAMLLASSWTAARLEHSSRSANHALRAVEAANQLHRSVEAEKLGVVAYLRTGEKRSLARCERDAAATDRALTALRNLNPMDTVIRARLDGIEAVRRQRAEANGRIIARRAAGPLDPADVLRWRDEEDYKLWLIHRQIDDEIESAELARLARSNASGRTFASSALVIDVVGGVIGFGIVLAAAIVTARDARARWRAERQLEHQSLHDALTGLPNRCLLLRQLDSSIHAAQSGGGSFALLMIDLDRFKQINDSLGHHYGDIVLQQVSPRIRTALRSTDLVARLGGDEFAVLLPGADRDTAVPVAEWILVAVGAPIEVDGHSLSVGASIGVAIFPDHANDANALLQRADQAMYAAKRTRAGLALYGAAALASEASALELTAR